MVSVKHNMYVFAIHIIPRHSWLLELSSKEDTTWYHATDITTVTGSATEGFGPSVDVKGSLNSFGLLYVRFDRGLTVSCTRVWLSCIIACNIFICFVENRKVHWDRVRLTAADIVKVIFLNGNCILMIPSLKFVPRSPINNRRPSQANPWMYLFKYLLVSVWDIVTNEHTAIW